jgi:hypothetical protein
LLLDHAQEVFLKHALGTSGPLSTTSLYLAFANLRF